MPVFPRKSHAQSPRSSGKSGYIGQSGDVLIDIAKANAAISVNGCSVTYDVAAHTATGTATGVGSTDLSSLLTLSGRTHTNAGTYYVSAHYSGDANHGVAVAIVINKASSTTTVTGGTFIFDGNAHGATASSVPSAGVVTGSPTLTYYQRITQLAGPPVNAGTYTEVATYAGEANHIGSTAEATIWVPIEEKVSVHWLTTLTTATARLADPARCVHIGDRGGDIFEWFGTADAAQTRFLVRIHANRRRGAERRRSKRSWSVNPSVVRTSLMFAAPAATL